MWKGGTKKAMGYSLMRRGTLQFLIDFVQSGPVVQTEYAQRQANTKDRACNLKIRCLISTR